VFFSSFLQKPLISSRFCQVSRLAKVVCNLAQKVFKVVHAVCNLADFIRIHVPVVRLNADGVGFHVNVVRKWLRTDRFSEDEFHESLTSPALPKA
jgi:hypothetical protein